MITRRAFGAGALAAPWLPGAARAGTPPAPATPVPYDLKDFYGDTETYDSALSPDGNRIAVLRTRKEKVPAPTAQPAGPAAKGGSPAPAGDDLKPIAYVDISTRPSPTGSCGW